MVNCKATFPYTFGSAEKIEIVSALLPVIGTALWSLNHRLGFLVPQLSNACAIPRI
jgi:hypothetical protein